MSANSFRTLNDRGAVKGALERASKRKVKTMPSEPLSKEQVEELERAEAILPAGPWELWTSCSFRRIGGPTGGDGDVLHAYNQRGDGHPDLSMPEEQLRALVVLRNALPALLAVARSAPSVDPPVTLETVTALKALAEAAVKWTSARVAFDQMVYVHGGWDQETLSNLDAAHESLTKSARAYAHSVNAALAETPAPPPGAKWQP